MLTSSHAHTWTSHWARVQGLFKIKTKQTNTGAKALGAAKQDIGPSSTTHSLLPVLAGDSESMDLPNTAWTWHLHFVDTAPQGTGGGVLSPLGGASPLVCV